MATEIGRRSGVAVLAATMLAVGVAAFVVAPEVAVHHVAQMATNLLYIGVGSVIVLRSRQRLIGWLLIVIGFGFNLGLLTFALDDRVAVDPRYMDSATLQRLEAPGALLVSLLLILILVYPTGRLISRSWRWMAGAVVAVGFLLSAMEWIEAGSDQVIVSDSLWAIVLVGMMALASTSLVVRYRRGSPVERRQIGWLAYGVFIAVAMYVTTTAVFGASDDVFLVVDAIASAITPLAILIAITRYRLYEIDRIINRTLVYGTVVAVLAGTYVGAVFLLGELLPGSSDLAVAASTLAVAALFNPLRKRVQRFVNRRFYRSRYNAQRVVEEFSTRLRNEVDLTHLIAQWVHTVDQAVKPASAAVWIRPSNGEPETKTAGS